MGKGEVREAWSTAGSLHGLNSLLETITGLRTGAFNLAVRNMRISELKWPKAMRKLRSVMSYILWRGVSRLAELAISDSLFVMDVVRGVTSDDCAHKGPYGKGAGLQSGDCGTQFRGRIRE